MPYISFLILLHDGLIAFFSLFISLYLRISDEFLNYTPNFLLKNLFIFVMITIGVFMMTKVYKVIWKFVSIDDLFSLGISVIIANVIYLIPMFLLAGDESFSFGIPWINVFVMSAFLMIPRLIVRFLHDHAILKLKKKNLALSIPVLLIGDETPTELLINEINSSEDLPYNPIGILTCKEHVEEGQTIHSIPILGSTSDLEKVLDSFKGQKNAPRQIIITDPKLSKSEKSKFIKKAKEKELVVLQMIQPVSLNVLPVDE
ncbi:MAG: hypothetical protein KBD31_05015 [Proteobacteria bacterium]|nr:hypothetical protein [Pseudomonadota bacterium]